MRRRLDRLDFYARPVRIDGVRVLHVPWLFRLPWFRRFHGYEMGPLILLRQPLAETAEDLVVHELCHVWQDQHRRLRLWTSYLYRGYRENPHEVEARRAVAETRERGVALMTRARVSAPAAIAAPLVTGVARRATIPRVTEDRLRSAVATVRAFAARSGAERVVVLLDEGDERAPTLIEFSEDGLEVVAGGQAGPAPEGGAPAALPDIRPAPPSALAVDAELGELEAPVGTVVHLADVVLALARTAGGRSVATADFPTRDPRLPLTIAAREGEPVVLAVGDRQFLLPEGAG